MDWFTNLTSIFSVFASLYKVAPEVKKYIDIGTPILAELQKTSPQIVPVLVTAGKALFPALTEQIDIVAAASDALFDPHGTTWVQNSLNTLLPQLVKKLVPDGSYGPLTHAAASMYQAARGLDVDGWVGPKTVAAIVADLAKLGQ